MFILVQKSHFKNKELDNYFPGRGTPINHHEANDNKKGCIWVWGYAKAKATDILKNPDIKKPAVYYKEEEHTQLQNRKRKYISGSDWPTYLITSKLVLKLPNICTIMLSGMPPLSCWPFRIDFCWQNPLQLPTETDPICDQFNKTCFKETALAQLPWPRSAPLPPKTSKKTTKQKNHPRLVILLSTS